MAGLNKITIHWTAGTNYPNEHDKKCYHFLVDKDGKVINGVYRPEDNINCNDGKYAQHCGGGNTGNIGISMCGMAGFTSRANVGKYPITAKQFEACCKKVAELCLRYNILVSDKTVFTHMEFGKTHPNTTSAGKIDICYLPHQPQLKSNEIGNYIRNKVLWYYYKLKG